MNKPKPYQSKSTQSHDIKLPRSSARWAVMGLIIAAAVPATFGAYGLYQESVISAAMPPGTGRCGMGSFAAWLSIVVGAPVFGLIGGAIGWIASRIRF